VNIALLNRLRAAGGAFVPVVALGADPAATLAALEELEAFGFALERHPYQGVAYRGPASRLCPDQIEWELGTRRVGRRVAVWDRVTSTNDLAARASGTPANDGLVILAEWQSAGRGRRGRSWSAPPASSLLMSLLLFPPPALDDPAWLTALAAVAAAEVVEAATGRDARIKWPNDVRVAARKVAGVLVERGPAAIVGIGLNVNLGPDDFPEALRDSASSLQVLAGAPLDRSELARALIGRLDAHYDRGLAEGPAALSGPWRARLEPLGRMVRLETAGGPVVGRLVDADLARGLAVATDGGRTRRVAAPEVLALSADGDLTAAAPDLGY
jgi:BirA family transcriptional regulator, biotin operon repressor / biotin---[acetyl-CoA-carboxylase] ligase